MRYWLSILLLAAMLSSCSAESTAELTTPGSTAAVVEATIPLKAVTVLPEATSVSKPLIIKVRPPSIPVVPVQETPGLPIPSLTPNTGWHTYTSAALGAAVDYPVDWSVNENAGSVKFTSPQGVSILLELINDLNSPSSSGQGCTKVLNPYGQTGAICYDAAAFRYSAVFKKTTDPINSALVISVISREKPAVFYQMFNTVRFLP
ncbi:MAG: hypothetical protein P4L50_09490 [Anaerolineaceae bacterium]|nr:hypothetical protein [Anaerolineaceae bacterium]